MSGDADRFLRHISGVEAEELLFNWRFWARSNQLEPAGTWRTWLVLAGRGWGKTRVGAETVRRWAESGRYKRMGLVAPTAADARDVMVEGEALCPDTTIPTPGGWRRLSDLKTDDSVFAANGAPVRVVAVQDWSRRPLHEVHFDNAPPLVADEAHLWFALPRSSRRRDAPPKLHVLSTGTMQQSLRKRRPDLLEYAVPLPLPLQYPIRDLPLDPYVLGAWLGDGDNRGHGVLTQHPDDVEVIDIIRARGFEVRKHAAYYEWGIQGIGALLRGLGVPYNKHIPDAYLRSAVEQRTALLAGLMDTDGTIDETGRCDYGGINRGLVEGVRQLAVSLGLRPGQIRTRPETDHGQPFHRFQFVAPSSLALFGLSRKRRRQLQEPSQSRWRLVRAIEPLGVGDSRCIQVEGDGSFLAGPDAVVTHNSGILAISHPRFRPVYEPSLRRLTWPNGAIATLYSADEPERLRGPQHEAVWADEVCAWTRPEAYDMLLFGLRLGNDPRLIVTTTPKPIKIIRDLVADAQTIISRGDTFENELNLAPAFVADIRRRYDGTRLGRQELYAEILDDVPGALWRRDDIDALRVTSAPDLIRVVVGIDPAVTSSAHSDETGIVAAGLGVDGRGYVLADGSCRLSPQQWAMRAVNLYRELSADRIVAEVNNGGDLVEAVLRMADPLVPYSSVHASRGKLARAEPIAALYEQKRIAHVGAFPELEQQMCSYVPGGYDGSPDRMDALVWAFTELFLEREEPATIVMYEERVRISEY